MSCEPPRARSLMAPDEVAAACPHANIRLNRTNRMIPGLCRDCQRHMTAGEVIFVLARDVASLTSRVAELEKRLEPPRVEGDHAALRLNPPQG